MISKNVCRIWNFLFISEKIKQMSKELMQTPPPPPTDVLTLPGPSLSAAAPDRILVTITTDN